jgi:hypothetical protein
MKITNKHGLPQTLVNAVERDPYSMGDARISATGLLRPPRISLLRHKHGPDIEEDVTDHIWSLFGRAVHKILEDGGDEEHITEERLYADVRGWRISGAVDLQKRGDKVAITDYKTCKAWAVTADKPDWERQLNIYRWLIWEAKGLDTERLSICAIIRDWTKFKVSFDTNYPEQPVVMIPVPIWPIEACKAFVEERVRLHQEAIVKQEMGDPLPYCTDEDRWMQRVRWAVKKAGNTRSTKVFDLREDAEEFAQQAAANKTRLTKNPDVYFVERQGGVPTRCVNNYCGVAPWCEQFAKWESEQGKQDVP